MFCWQSRAGMCGRVPRAASVSFFTSQGVAFSARHLKISAKIVMPCAAPEIKVLKPTVGCSAQ